MPVKKLNDKNPASLDRANISSKDNSLSGQTGEKNAAAVYAGLIHKADELWSGGKKKAVDGLYGISGDIEKYRLWGGKDWKSGDQHRIYFTGPDALKNIYGLRIVATRRLAPGDVLSWKSRKGLKWLPLGDHYPVSAFIGNTQMGGPVGRNPGQGNRAWEMLTSKPYYDVHKQEFFGLAGPAVETSIAKDRASLAVLIKYKAGEYADIPAGINVDHDIRDLMEGLEKMGFFPENEKKRTGKQDGETVIYNEKKGTDDFKNKKPGGKTDSPESRENLNAGTAPGLMEAAAKAAESLDRMTYKESGSPEFKAQYEILHDFEYAYYTCGVNWKNPDDKDIVRYYANIRRLHFDQNIPAVLKNRIDFIPDMYAYSATLYNALTEHRTYKDGWYEDDKFYQAVNALFEAKNETELAEAEKMARELAGKKSPEYERGETGEEKRRNQSEAVKNNPDPQRKKSAAREITTTGKKTKKSNERMARFLPFMER
jgi:hypothetical protein